MKRQFKQVSTSFSEAPSLGDVRPVSGGGGGAEGSEEENSEPVGNNSFPGEYFI